MVEVERNIIYDCVTMAIEKQHGSLAIHPDRTKHSEIIPNGLNLM